MGWYCVSQAHIYVIRYQMVLYMSPGRQHKSEKYAGISDIWKIHTQFFPSLEYLFLILFIYSFSYYIWASVHCLISLLGSCFFVQLPILFMSVQREPSRLGEMPKINNQKAKDPTTNGRRARFAFLLLKMYFTVISHCFSPLVQRTAILFNYLYDIF